jgi:hypothetical protein
MPDIQQLQLDLAELGFMLVGSADGVAGLKTEMAIREFQRYAKMIGICQEAAPGTPGTYVERLSPALNPAPYTGPIGGAPDDATVALVALWKTNRFRCPVIVQAWNMSGGAPSTLADDNIWLKDEVTSTAHVRARFFGLLYVARRPRSQRADRHRRLHGCVAGRP